jgi:peptidoglycan/xylan/chitin deacetylase (PgdA/CDA1 family)
MKQSRFIISLDFELYWGVRDKRTIASYGANIRGVKEVIPALLKVFDQYGVDATFATVGFLFADNKKELLQHLPSVLPNYSDKNYSPYENNYLETIGQSEADDPYHFGRSLLRMIQNHPNHEIATHTFSHYYCLENASLASFESDLLSAKKIAESKGIQLTSIVFPRNQYSTDHIGVCKKLGIVAYRGNETASVYQPRSNEDNSRKIRAMRLLDAYINLTGHHTFRIEKGEVINLPASRFLRPFSPTLRLLEPLRLKRIKNSMTYAAKNGECYHLWWHPHNFGVNRNENIYFLEKVLQHYQLLHRSFGMQSSTMKSIAEGILRYNEVH